MSQFAPAVFPHQPARTGSPAALVVASPLILLGVGIGLGVDLAIHTAHAAGRAMDLIVR